MSVLEIHNAQPANDEMIRKWREENEKLLWTDTPNCCVGDVEKLFARVDAEKAGAKHLETMIENRNIWLEAVEDKLAVAREALQLIASPARSDGTYNRDRRACEEVAKQALRTIGGAG